MASHTLSNTSLELEFVYGYHGSRCRDNLFYGKDGEIVYHIAAVGIVFNPKKNSQRFFLGHDDDIVALTQHPDGNLIATGQLGKDPYICVWDSTTTETVSILRGFHERGICALGFSEDGNYLVSVGLDNDHTLAIWDWKNGRVIASSKGDKERVFDIALSPYSNTIVSCGINHIKFWKYSGNSLICKNGIFGKVGERQSIVCITFGHDDGLIYTGTAKGEVYIWKENVLIRVVKCHRGPVYTVGVFKDGFLTGGKDGKVAIWSKDFEAVDQINIDPKKVVNVRSIKAGESSNFLVGTKDSEIFDVKWTGKGSAVVEKVMDGHGEGELWGLDMNPSNHQQFLTCSDDKCLKLWDSNSRKCIYSVDLPQAGRSCGMSPDGHLFAVGFLTGHAGVWDIKGRQQWFKKISKEEISQAKFSPDGKYVAFGSHDNNVIIMGPKDGSKLGKCRGNTSFVTHLDWSKDSKFIRTNSGSYELLYFEIPSCKHYAKGNPAKSNDGWASWTGILGDEVEGIWPKYSDKTDINATDVNLDGTLIATGDDFGLVKLFNYPVPKGTKFHKFRGHSAHVTNVKFGNDFVVSTGGGDQAILQWKIKTDIPLPSDSEVEAIGDINVDSDVELEKEMNYDRKRAHLDDAEAAAAAATETGTGEFTMEAPDVAAKAGRPGLGYRSAAKVGPKPKPGRSVSTVADASDAPKDAMSLDWIYGYRGFDTRNNVHYASNGSIVYHNAAAGVVYNPKDKTQQYLLGVHTDDIICLDVSLDGKTVASGQVGKNPRIVVWDPETCDVMAILKNFHERGICALGFSPNGKSLVSVGLDNEHSIAIWDWASGTCQATAKGDKGKVFVAKYNPFIEGQVVTAGVKHIKFWKVVGNGLIQKKGIFGKAERTTFVSVAFDKTFVYAGAENGKIYKWAQDHTVASTINAHKGPVFALNAVAPSSSGKFVTGGKDGFLKVWAAGFAKEETSFDAGAVAGTNEGAGKFVFCIRTAEMNGNKILAGNRGGKIIEVDIAKKSFENITWGHGYGEVWGLATHPTKHLFATTSDDKRLLIHDGESKSVIHETFTKRMGRCCAFSPDGTMIAIGFRNGAVEVFSFDGTKTGDKPLFDKRLRKEEISDVKFSPDGKYLGVGSHDNYVDILAVGKWTKVAKLEGSSSFITHFDFSTDGKICMTNSGAYEQLFFELPSGKRITPDKSVVKRMKWATWTGVLGAEVSGIYPPDSDGTDVNATDRSHQETLATADDFGKVKLFNFPAVSGAKFKEYSGHSSHVTNVRFAHDDAYVVTTGGLDASVFQWKYEDLDNNYHVDVEADDFDSDVERELSMKYVGRKEKINSLLDTSKDDEKTDFEQVKAQVDAMRKYEESRRAARKSKKSGGKGGGTGEFAAQEMRDRARGGNPRAKKIYGKGDMETDGAADDGSIEKSLELDYIHGYRAVDSHDNLYHLASGEVVYHVAGVGVVLDPKKNTQRFFLGHNDDIVSLAYDPNQEIIATGQVGKKPKICVWSAKTLETLSVLTGVHTHAVKGLNFSPSGKLLVSLGGDPNNTIAVWNWKEGVCLANEPGLKGSQIFDITFYPYNETDFVTVGQKHVAFWTLSGGHITKRNGIFGKAGPQNTQLSVIFSRTQAFTATVSGKIYHWDLKSRKLTKVVDAHAGPCFSINPLEGGGGFVSGGKDGKLLYWNDKVDKPTKEVSLPGYPVVKTVNSSSFGELSGTRDSDIYWIDNGKPTCIMNGHGAGELWGLAAHPSKNWFATASDDKTLRVWDSDKKQMVSSFTLPKKARSVDISPDGKALAVGYISGAFAVFDFEGKPIFQKRQRKEAIHEIKYSPNGKFLAVGSHDNFVDVYDVDKSYAFVGTCQGNSSYITHVDWSKDSAWLTTNSGAYEQLLFAIPACRFSPKREHVAHLHEPGFWQTWTGVLGKEIEGIWPAGSDHTDVNALDLTTSAKWFATGDDFGMVKVFKYPCPKKSSPHKKYHGHSAHVTNVRFNHNDSYLFSIGGGDQSVFLWKFV